MGGLFGGGKSVDISSPVITSLRLQTSGYGRCIPLCYGKTRLAGNLIWYSDFKAIPHTSSQSGGGKGGGGGGDTTQTSYTYTTAAIMGLCEGAISAVPTVWADKAQSSTGALGLSVYLGDTSQTAFPYVTTNHPGEALGYRQLAYVATGAYDLGDNASLPNHTFEVEALLPFSASIRDALPSAVLSDFLTHASHGAGYPAARLGSLTAWAGYCTAAGLFVSPAYTEQAPAGETVTKLTQIGNAAPVYSEGVLKIIPYADQAVTGNGVTYTPNTTPVYALTDDDFLDQGGDDPVIVQRGDPADAYNQVQVKFYNRLNQYNEDVVTAVDQASIELYGLRPMEPVEMHEICDPAVAQIACQLLLQRAQGIRSTYRFRLGWKYCLLEPMDLVTLTEGGDNGLNGVAVRITAIEENEDGDLDITAEDAPAGVSTGVQYPVQANGGYSPLFNQSPGLAAAPAFCETRSGSDLVVNVAVTGQGPLWGGCDVWCSLDGSTYKYMATVNGGARYGILKAATGSATTDTLDVQLAGTGGQLLSGTSQDADLFLTDCYVGGEFVAYETATLTAANRYTLANLRRGGYGSPATAHGIDSPFIRLDDAIVQSDPLDTDMVGKPIYFKFLSFNIWGGGRQGLSDVTASQYNITGAPLLWSLANVANLVDVFRDGRTMLAWDAVTDDRDFDYEVRKGASWATAQVLGRVTATEFVADGDGTYWVAAHAGSAYSGTPTAITIAGSILAANVVATYDEEAAGWAGTCGGGAFVSGTDIVLGGAGVFSTIPLLSVQPTVAYYGGVAASGTYDIPTAHEVDVGTSQPCNVAVSYRMRADSPFALFSAIPLLSSQASIAGNYSGKADCKMQIAIAPDSGVYGAWRDFVPGKYLGRKFKFRAQLSSSDATVTAVLDTLDFTVDMPDRVERGTAVNCPAGGLTVTYAKPFQIAPNVQATILNAAQNDDVVITSQTAAGFTVQILQGGVGVARTINWLAQGY